MIFKIEVTAELLIDLYASLENLLPWQSRWYQHRFDRFRFLHKGRQIGASDYFSLEALLDACLTGENKTFVTPSSADNEEFQSSELFYLARHAGIDKAINGDEKNIYLSNGAKIYFISDKEMPPDDCGDVYISEWVWFDDPKETLKRAKVMGALGSIIKYDDSKSDGYAREQIMEALRNLGTNNNAKNIILFNVESNIDVIPLNTSANKGRITLYSSRVTGDNGNKINHEQMFNGFYDVVPNITIEVGRNLVDEEKRRSWLRRYGSKMFNELYLCKMPPSSRVRQPPRKP